MAIVLIVIHLHFYSVKVHYLGFVVRVGFRTTSLSINTDVTMWSHDVERVIREKRFKANNVLTLNPIVNYASVISMISCTTRDISPYIGTILNMHNLAHIKVLYMYGKRQHRLICSKGEERCLVSHE